jgi:hypothetical protein
MKDWRKRLTNLYDNLVSIVWSIAILLVWFAGVILYAVFPG